MSADRNSDRNLDADPSAILEADLRLDARLRQRLLATRDLVPEPSAHMLAALREAAQQEVASRPQGQVGAGGLVGWVASRPRHLWAAMGAVAVGGAAVAGLVMLQASNLGVDRQASGIVARAELTQAETSPIPAGSSGGLVGGATAPTAAVPAALAPAQVESEKDAPPKAKAVAKDETRADVAAQETVGRGQAGLRGEAGKVKVGYDRSKSFAQAPADGIAAELAEPDDNASRAGLANRKGADQDKDFGAEQDDAIAVTETASAPRASATAKVDAAMPPAAPVAPMKKPMPVDVQGLAKAGRCGDATKAAAARRKSDASYTAALAEADLAPCRSESVKSRAKSAPVKASPK